MYCNIAIHLIRLPYVPISITHGPPKPCGISMDFTFFSVQIFSSDLSLPSYLENHPRTGRKWWVRITPPIYILKPWIKRPGQMGFGVPKPGTYDHHGWFNHLLNGMILQVGVSSQPILGWSLTIRRTSLESILRKVPRFFRSKSLKWRKLDTPKW